jgi:hypothetical protein
MPLTDIAALFSDIVETPQQRQQRLLAEGQASAGQFTGLPTGIRELAMGISSNIPRNVEAVRRFGVQAGLPMETQGEQLQGAMANFDIDDSNSRMAVLNQLKGIDPMRAVAFGEMLKERDAQQAAAKEASRLTTLQIENEVATQQARRDQEAHERTQALAAQTETAARRQSMIMMANSSSHLNPAEVVSINNFVNGGGYDDNADGFFAMVMPDSDWKKVEDGDNWYDSVNGEWLIPPADQARGNRGAVNVFERYGISAVRDDPGSMARLNTRIAEINNMQDLTPVERFALEEEAVNTIILPRYDNEKWEEYPDWDENGDEIIDEDGNIVMKWFSVPSTSDDVRETYKELDSINSRNRTLSTHAENGLGAIGRIEDDLAQAEANGEQIVGSVWDVLQSLYPGSHGEYELASEIDNLKAILGLTGLAEARQGSASGASGFGQLTESEMRILQDRIASLRQGGSIEKFKEDLGIIKRELQKQRRIGSVVLEYAEYVGTRPRPKPPQRIDIPPPSAGA